MLELSCRGLPGATVSEVLILTCSGHEKNINDVVHTVYCTYYTVVSHHVVDMDL